MSVLKISNTDIYYRVVDLVSITVWLYVLLSTFSVSLDALISHYTSFSIINIFISKWIAITLILIMIGYIGGKNKLSLFVAYVLFFPIILLLVRLPILLAKIGSWGLAISIVNAILEFFYRLRQGELTVDESKKWLSSVQTRLFFSRSILLAGEIIQDYNNSNINLISGIMGSVKIFFYTVFSYSIVYYSIDGVFGNISIPKDSSKYFSVFSLSFYTMFFSTPEGINISGAALSALKMSQMFLSLLLVAVIIAMLVGVQVKKESKELEKTVQMARSTSKNIEEKITSDYNASSIDDIIEEMQKIEAGFIKIIISMTENIHKRRGGP